MKSLFDLFDEAKSIYRNDKLKVNPQSANYHFGLTKDKVASERIRKEILGWEVWFLNETDSPDFKGWVEGQEREVYDVLSALQQLGVRKTMRHPIFIHFGKGSGPSKLADDNAGGLAVSKTAVRGHGINIKDTPGVHIYANLSKDIKETLVHEITHIIYSTLSFEQQKNIKMLANSSYSPSFYGMPGTVFNNQKNPHVHHSSGNEWFAEMVSLS